MRNRLESVAARLFACVALLAPLGAQAERYRVDLILFEDGQSPAAEAPLTATLPEAGNAIEPFETARLRAAGIEVLPDSEFALAEAWKRLANSRRHKPLLRLAWVQTDPPAERGPSIRLRTAPTLPLVTESGTTTLHAVDGSVALLLGRFLHLDADFAYTFETEDLSPASYRLRERRRMRRDELHHLDSPKLGLLVRVVKAPEAAAKN